MKHPLPNEVWFNKITRYNEDIISVDDRVLTSSFSCDYDLFLRTYTFNYEATVQTLQDKIDRLTSQLVRTQSKKDALD